MIRFEPEFAVKDSQIVLRGTPWVEKRHFAATALESWSANVLAGNETWLSEVYDRLRGGGHHSKYTTPGRLRDLDGALARVLDARRPATSELHIHDMAASNAITSLELFQVLSACRRVFVRASDFYDRALVVGLRDCLWQVVFDVDLRPVQYVGRRMMVSARRPDPRAPSDETVIKPRLQAALLPSAIGALTRFLRGERERRTSDLEAEVRELPLFHPRCRALAESGRGFTLAHDDVFDPAPGSYDVVRVMNTLSTDFLPVGRILEGVRAVSRTVAEDGLLVLGRNAGGGDGRSCATIFGRQGDRLLPVTDVNEGYELKESVLQLSLT